MSCSEYFSQVRLLDILLQENIKSFVIAVLLSSKLGAYKWDSVPVGHVMV